MDIWRIHKDYDILEEPSRMWIGLFFLSPFFLGLAFVDSDPIWALGIIFGCLIGLYRIAYFIVYDR